MAICQGCGGNISASETVCPTCGTPVQPKKKKAPVVFKTILIILLVLMVGAGGLFGYGLYQIYGTQNRRTAFDYNVSKLTTELNRLLEADKTELRVDSRKWALNETGSAALYDGGSFTMRAKLENEKKINSNIRELRVGPTNTEDGVKLAAVSAVALEKNITQQTVAKDMGDVKGQLKDKVSYEIVAFTYDRDKDEFVMVPSKGAKSPEHYGSTADQATPLAVTNSVYVSGKYFIEAGGKFVYTDGSGIRCRKSVNGDSKKITEAKSDGQLLSDGSTVYFVTDSAVACDVCSVSTDGTSPRTLFSSQDKIILLHFYNNCLYYLRESAGSQQAYTFCKYRMDTQEFSQFDDVHFMPDRAVVSGNLLYFSDTSQNVTDLQTIAAYCFNFDTEKCDEVVSHCIVAPRGYINGVGNPCMDSHQVDETGGRYTEHYLYTSVDGELQKSAEVTVNATLLFASPTTDTVVLYDNSLNRHYVFDRKTGDVRRLEVPGAGAFAYDVEHPEKLYFYTIDTTSSDRRLSGVYLLADGKLQACKLDSKEIHLGLNPVITGGCIIDSAYNAHTITDPAVAEATKAPATTAPPADTDVLTPEQTPLV